MDCKYCGCLVAPFCVDCGIMTVNEAMGRLHVSRVTVERWVKSGKLPPIRKVHRRVLLRREDVERLLTPKPHKPKG